MLIAVVSGGCIPARAEKREPRPEPCPVGGCAGAEPALQRAVGTAQAAPGPAVPAEPGRAAEAGTGRGRGTPCLRSRGLCLSAPARPLGRLGGQGGRAQPQRQGRPAGGPHALLPAAAPGGKIILNV